MDTRETARQMLASCEAEGQAAHRIPSDEDAALVRDELRRSARQVGLRIRTARLDDTVVVARTDAQVWRDDRATMRRKLTPPDRSPSQSIGEP